MFERLLTIGLVLFLSTITPSIGNAQSDALVDLFEERTFQFTGGQYQDAEIRYRLHVPERIRSGRTYPLVVHLHGFFEAGSCNRRSLLFLDSILPLLTGPKQQDFFMLVVQNPSETPHWSFQRTTRDGTLDVLVAAIDHVIADNPIDTKRISVNGICGHAGQGIWELILEQPNKFAGAVLTASSAPQHFSRLAALTQMPIWSIVDMETEYSFKSNQIAMHLINDAGGSMAFTKIYTAGEAPWKVAMENYNSIQWLLAQKKEGWSAPPPGVVIQEPHSLLPIVFMYFLPFAIIVFFTWNTLCEWVTTTYQSARAWIS